MPLPKESENYCYKCTMFIIDYGNGSTEQVDPNLVYAIGIEKDYDADYFPITYFNVALTPLQWNGVLENKTKARFRIRIDRFIMDQEGTPPTGRGTPIINGSFAMYTQDNEKKLDLTLYNQTKEVTGETGTSMNDVGVTRDLYVFIESAVNASRVTCNAVLLSAPVHDMMTYLLNKCGVPNVLMSPNMNGLAKDQTILPPLTFIRMFEYLEEKYGLYPHGALLFFDYNTTYLIDKSSECTAWRENEYKTTLITVFKSEKSDQFINGSWKDHAKKINIIHITRTNVFMRTNSIINNEVEASTYKLVNAKSGKVSSVNASTQHRGGNTEKIVTDNMSNSYLAGTMANRQRGESESLEVAFTDIDITMLEPNKSFVFKFEDTDIDQARGGKYRISFSKFSIDIKGKLSGKAIFKRTT